LDAGELATVHAAIRRFSERVGAGFSLD
jgi:hypothetical protein